MSSKREDVLVRCELGQERLIPTVLVVTESAAATGRMSPITRRWAYCTTPGVGQFSTPTPAYGSGEDQGYRGLQPCRSCGVGVCAWIRPRPDHGVAVREADDAGIDMHVAGHVRPGLGWVVVDHERVHLVAAGVEFFNEDERGVGLLDGPRSKNAGTVFACQIPVHRI